MGDKKTKPLTPEQQKKLDKDKEEKEKQIQIAVKFLSNPEIANASDSTKRSFLKKKGLSDEDIDKAYQIKKEKEEEAQKFIQTQGQVQQRQAPKQARLSDDEMNDKVFRAESSNVLLLRNNEISNLDPKIFSLQNLQVLVVSFNPLQALPEDFKNLQNLKIFHAVGCQLHDHQITQELWNIKSLKMLNLSRNNLTQINEVGQLSSLTILDVSFNSIFELPEDIGSLTELKVLNLSHNNLSFLPQIIKSMSNLKKLVIQQLHNQQYLQDNLFEISDESVFRTKYNEPQTLLAHLEIIIDPKKN